MGTLTGCRIAYAMSYPGFNMLLYAAGRREGRVHWGYIVHRWVWSFLRGSFTSPDNKGPANRFFQGNAQEMDTALNKTLGSLPPDTKVYVFTPTPHTIDPVNMFSPVTSTLCRMPSLLHQCPPHQPSKTSSINVILTQ